MSVLSFHRKQWVSIPGAVVNEDGGGMRPSLAWLLDGATGLVQERLLPGESDAQWLVNEACVFFEQLQLPVHLSALSELLSSRFQVARLRPPSAVAAEQVPSAGLTLATIDGQSLTIANIGDCKTLVRLPDGATRSFGESPVTTLDAQVVARLIELQRSHPNTSFSDLKRELAPIIKQNRRLKNQPNGYGVLEPAQPWPQYVQYFTLDVPPGTHVLMLSDGFYRLVDHYHVHTDESIVTAAIDEGLGSMARRLRQIEQADPECRTYPRLKPQDDASAQLLYLAPDTGGMPK